MSHARRSSSSCATAIVPSRDTRGGSAAPMPGRRSAWAMKASTRCCAPGVSAPSQATVTVSAARPPNLLSSRSATCSDSEPLVPKSALKSPASAGAMAMTAASAAIHASTMRPRRRKARSARRPRRVGEAGEVMPPWSASAGRLSSGVERLLRYVSRRTPWPGATSPASYAKTTSCARSRAPSLSIARLDVGACGGGGDHELLGDLVVGEPGADERDDLALALGQLAQAFERRGLRRVGRRRTSPRRVW